MLKELILNGYFTHPSPLSRGDSMLFIEEVLL
jgi:hypothetical protein